MGYNTSYDTRQLVDEIIRRFDLDKQLVKRESLKKTLMSICKTIPAVKRGQDTSLYEKSKVYIDGRSKPKHIFTAREVEQILNNYDLRKYIIKNQAVNSDELQKKFKQELAEEERYIKAAKERNKANKELTLLPTADDVGDSDYHSPEEERNYLGGDFYTLEDVRREKLYMMVEALFLKYFTPIDEDLLFDDMNLYPYSASTGDNFTPEEMKAFERFEKKAYYKPLDNK